MTQAERQQAKDPRFVEKTKLVRSGRQTLQKPEGWVFRVLQMIPGARHYTFRLDGPFREFADPPWGGGRQNFLFGSAGGHSFSSLYGLKRLLSQASLALPVVISL